MGSAQLELRRATVRKVSWRLLPLLFALFIASFLDRTNLGVASLQMNRDLALSATAYVSAACGISKYTRARSSPSGSTVAGTA